MKEQPQTSETHRESFRNRLFDHTPRNVPDVTLTASYVYQYSPNYLGANRSLVGWSVTPEVNFTRYLGFQTEFTSLYMQGVNVDQNRFMMAAGPRFTFASHSRLLPFVFGEGGEIRATNQLNDASSWNPVATAGIGVDYKVSHGLSLQLIPGEFVGQLHDSGNWDHSFMAKLGITFNLYNK